MLTRANASSFPYDRDAKNSMKISVVWCVALVVACGNSAAGPSAAQQTVATVTLPVVATPASAPTSPPNPRPHDSFDYDVSLCEQAMTRWLGMLGRNEDARFLDDAMSPEDRETIFKTTTMAQLVDGFVGEKHGDFVHVITVIRGTGTSPQERRDDHGRMLLTYDAPHVRNLTLIVDRRNDRVYVKD